ncbi:hypothetical protein IW138_002494 [Coemansia sp. RSA 986]|nr:hypothetical protein IW138_002494 [Coemansia sp. RSA 986]
MKLSAASSIPKDCLLLILDHLWEDRPVAQFIERRSEYSQDYDQIRIHHALCSRAISPIHVCRAWRQHSIHRYFRYVSIGTVDRPCKANSRQKTSEGLPPAARVFVETLLLQVDTAEDNFQLGVAGAGLARLLPYDLPRARRIGLCVRDSMPRHSHHATGWFSSYLQKGVVLENHLALEILNKLPSLDCVWFQSTTTAGIAALSLVRTLTSYAELVDQQRHSPWASGMPTSLVMPKHTGKVRVSSVHLLSTTANDGDTAIDIIRECANDIQHLCLGMVSGGVLSKLIQWRPNRKGHTARTSTSTVEAASEFANGSQSHTISEENNAALLDAASTQQAVAAYPKLQRLIFGVDTHVHVAPSAMAPLQGNGQPQDATAAQLLCPFPALEELYFDHTLSNGLPMEEWYAPLYDIFLKHANMKLKYLTFPIIYNTQRVVSRRNCPELVSLRHIKCCWSTGVWSVAQAESDSTRVLKAVATIPTLTCYIHPSYIEGLSALPTEINCIGLKYLDLYGWPLSLDNILWLLSTFENIRSLSVTVVPTVHAPLDGDHASLVGEQPPNSSHRYSSAALEPLPEATGMVLRHLVVGAGGSDLGDLELSRLFIILNSLPNISTVSLYSSAYSFVKTNLEACCDLCFPDTGFLQASRVRISNLDSAELHSIQPYSARDGQTNRSRSIGSYGS